MILVGAWILCVSPLAQEPAPAPDDRPRPVERGPVPVDWWDLGRNYVAFGAAHLGWTVDDDFEDTKAIFEGHYVLQRELGEPSGSGRRKESLRYLLDASLEIGDSDVDVQYGAAAFTWRAEQTTRPMRETGKIERLRDKLEIGRVLASYDDTLGLDYYYELNVMRLGRSWSYRHDEDSEFGLRGAFTGSIGWAWARTEDDAYGDMSNAVVGINPVLVLTHRRFGLLYIDYAINPGFDIGEPKGTFSRTASARFGYRIGLGRRTAIDLFYEKRSFHVDDFDLPDLYTKTRRVGVELVIGLN